MSKIVIILHAEPGTHDSMGRALHALLYSLELKGGGVDVKLVFDGGGTKWVEELIKPSHKLNPVFKKVRSLGIIDGICDFCVGAFEADRNAILADGLSLTSEFEGHPSILKYVNEGYQIVTL